MSHQLRPATILLLLFCLCQTAVAKGTWPPKVGMPYPDLKLLNQDGEMTKLSSFKGKVIIVEPIGMTCPACNAFADVEGVGGFKGNQQQAGIHNFKKLAKSYGRVQLPNRDVVVIHLLLYNQKMKPPTLKDAKAWAQHFGLSTFNNEYVLVGKKKHQVYELVPGFQLINRDFTLVSDSTGHHPKHDMYRDLFPKLGRLLSK